MGSGIRPLLGALASASLSLSLVICSATLSAAAETLEVPPPSTQTAPKLPPKARKKITTEKIIRQHQEETIEREEPAPPPPPPPVQSYQPAEPLPEVFRGCWEGVVPAVDTLRRLPGAPPTGPWAAKTYRLCYRRVGNGPFELQFTDLGIAHHHLITNPGGRLEVVSSDGRSYATMQAQLHFDERYIRPTFMHETFAVDEKTDLNAQIVGDEMRVTARVYGERDGMPWFEATWHAIFVHTSG